MATVIWAPEEENEGEERSAHGSGTNLALLISTNHSYPWRLTCITHSPLPEVHVNNPSPLPETHVNNPSTLMPIRWANTTRAHLGLP